MIHHEIFIFALLHGRFVAFFEGDTRGYEADSKEAAVGKLVLNAGHRGGIALNHFTSDECCAQGFRGESQPLDVEQLNASLDVDGQRTGRRAAIAEAKRLKETAGT